MERYAKLSKDGLLNLEARVNEASVPAVFTFLNEDGSAHDISSYDFELIVKKIPQAGQNVFKLTVGSGLTIGGAGNNELTIEITAAQATVNPNVYFWRLYASAEDHTWLSGDFEFYAGKPKQRTQTETITIAQSGTPVTITIG